MADSAGGGGGGGEGVSCASPSSILLRSTVKSETRMTPPPPPTPPIEVPLKEEQSPWDTDTNCDFIVNGDEVDVHQDDRAMTLRTNGASSGVADLNGKPSSSSSSTQSPEIVVEPAINPGTDGKDDGDCSNDGSSSSSSEGLEAPKPMEGLKEVGTPPFLKKTYEMVEDPDSDAVVSWGVDRKSFVVWNPHEFSDHLLPKYFKHRNFSSFIRQLNTYGFRKVDPNRWEFANEGFQGGKKHLLKNIKRRSRVPRNHREPTVSANIETPVAGADAQIQTMKNDQDALLKEILKLRQQQETSEKEISTVEERIRRAECRHQQMILFLARAVKSPSFVDQLIQKRKQKREIDAGGFIKKRKLLDDNLRPTRSIFKGANIGGDHDCHRDACGGGLSEMLPPCSNENSSVGFSTPTPDENFSNAADQMSDAILGDLRSFYHAMSEKLLDDRNLMGEGGNGEQMDVNDSKIYLELECLIGMPREWDLACGGISADDLNPCKETTVGLMP